MVTNSDDLILSQSIDPKTKKIGIRHVTGHNDGGTRTEIAVRDFPVVVTDEPDTMGGTNTAPSPLETVLVALVGCDGVIINGVAEAMGFRNSGVDFACTSQIDIRGPKGVSGVRPYFETVELQITLHTDEPGDRVEKLKANVENRCPAMNLLRDAGVELDVDWRTVSA
jgi:putative redox protein